MLDPAVRRLGEPLLCRFQLGDHPVRLVAEFRPALLESLARVSDRVVRVAERLAQLHGHRVRRGRRLKQARGWLASLAPAAIAPALSRAPSALTR